MEREITEFLDKLKEKKNISGNTENSYRRDLLAMSDFLANIGVTDVNMVNNTHLNSYISELEISGRKPSTVSRTIASMHSFFDYLFHNKMIDEDPSYEIKAPKIIKKEPEILSGDEMNRLLAQPDKTSPKGLRDKAMLEIICSTGLRVSEAISLKIDDLNQSQGYVKFEASNSVKLLYYSSNAAIAVSEYIKNGRPELVKDCEVDVLFPNCYAGTMSRQGFWKIIKEYASSAGIQKEITPHTLRNYYLNNSRTSKK